MVEPLLIISILIGFFIAFLFTPIWIRQANKVNINGRDVHKIKPEKIAEAGGVTVLFGFIAGLLFYIGTKTFYFSSSSHVIEMFAMLTSLLIIAFIGFTDDILGWKIGLTKKIRILFLFFAAIPLMAINVGESEMIGVQFGIFYPLIFIPLGIIGASSVYNFLAGYNGLETSQGILILSALALVTWLTGNSWLSVVCLIMVFSLVAFYIFNKCPAKILPGDVLTYTIGGMIAAVAILGNIEKIAVFFFIPYILEFILKVRGKLKKESFAKLNSDGSLDMPYEKIYSLTHFSIYLLKKIKPSKKVYETEVVVLINFFQIIIILIGLILFGGTIF